MKRSILVLSALALMATPVLAEDDFDVEVIAPQAEQTTEADLNGEIQYQQQWQQQPQQQQVYQQPPARPEPQAHEYFELERAEGDLGKYSKKKFQAVTYTIKNTQPFHVELIQAEVPAALDEAAVAQQKKAGGGAARFGLKAASLGLGVASSFIPYGGGGLAAYQTAAALGHASHVAGSAANIAASSNSSGNLEISGRYVQKINNVVLSPNQTFTFTALLPKEGQPLVKMIFKNLETNRIYDLTK